MTPGILQVIILLLRTSLGAVLVAAGAAKLADTRSFAATLLGLGVPVQFRLLVRGLALLVPLLELGLGLAIVSGLWPTIINAAVLVLMGLFSIVVMVALSRKVQVACRCFGTLSDSQFSRIGLIRSLLLTGVAAFVFWSGITYSLQFSGPPVIIVLLIGGFSLFASGAGQAAKTLALLKESISR